MKALFHYTLMAIMPVLFAVNAAMAQPANNDCASATVLTVGASCVPTAGTTVLATQSIPAITCAGFAATTALDVWYQFVATAANLNVTVVGDVNFDAVIDVRSGACDGTNIACADATVSGGTEVAALTGLVIGNTYLVRVYDFSGTATFTICVAPPPAPPANDNCAGAIAFGTILNDGVCVNATVTTVAATGTADAVCTGTEDDDVWFTFTTPAGITSLLYANTSISGSTDRVLQIYSGTCAGLTSIGCYDPESGTITGLTGSTTYFLRAYTWSAGVTTTFNLCLRTTPPPPANDNCAGALPVPVNPDLNCTSVTAGTVASATASTGPTSSCGTYDDDVWFSFVATATTHLIELLNITGSTTDLTHQVLSSCGAATALVCSDPNTSTVTSLTIGQTYYIRVATWTSTTGQTSAFNVCVKTNPPPPTCPGGLGAGTVNIASLPYNGVGLTNCGSGNNITAANATVCGSTSYYGGEDKTFVFTPTATGVYDIILTTASTWSGLMLYAGCPFLGQGGTCVANAQSSVGNKTLNVNLTAGTTYYLVVDSWPSPTCHPSFDLSIASAIPPCTAPGTPVVSNITSNSATVNWTAAPGALTYDWTVGTGASCPTGVGANTASTSLGLSGLIPNTTYRVCVRTSTCGGGAASDYVTTTFTTAPLPNDACAGAQTVTCGSTINGSTVGATSDAAIGSCGIGTGGTPGNGVWYKLVGNGGQVTASLCGSAYNTKLHVYTGSCAGLTCLVSNDDNTAACGAGSTRSQVVFNANVGTDYYILVSGSGSATGAFSLNLTCLCGPALGAPWTVTNIGATNGGAIENVCDGTIDVKATNYGSPTNDIQTYAWQQLCGNGFIKAKVENVINGGWGGIMFRENNAGGSKKVALRTQLTSTVVRDLRANTNGVVQQQQFPRPNTPQWLRLTRTGNVFVGETSVDGVSWDFTFNVTMVLPSCIEVGLFAQSINVNTATTAVFSNIMGVPTSPPVIPLVDGGNNGNVEVQQVLSLFPNPATDEINVKMEAFYGKNVTISVQNQLGQVMLQRDIDEVQDATERIELTNLPSGIYTLTLRTAGQAPVSKQFMVGSARP